jgi:hypothetical protein
VDVVGHDVGTWICYAYAAITPADLDEYVRVHAAVGATRAALSCYRHVFSPEGLEQSRARTERQLRLPILAFGADNALPRLQRRIVTLCRRKNWLD